KTMSFSQQLLKISDYLKSQRFSLNCIRSRVSSVSQKMEWKTTSRADNREVKKFFTHCIQQISADKEVMHIRRIVLKFAVQGLKKTPGSF
ncbi:hypothetical protein L9F63_004303, partial [Diploptera punctata]